MSFATEIELTDRPGSLTPRGVFVPPWYKPHEDLDMPVVGTNGHKLGFTIADVAVERRWAIAPDGVVMPRNEFTDKLTEWYIGQWTWRNPPQPPLPIDTSAYPTPESYVSKGPDPGNARRLIGLILAHQPKNPVAVAPSSERPVDPVALAKSGWRPAPKKDGE